MILYFSSNATPTFPLCGFTCRVVLIPFFYSFERCFAPNTLPIENEFGARKQIRQTTIRAGIPKQEIGLRFQAQDWHAHTRCVESSPFEMKQNLMILFVVKKQ